LSNEEEVSTLNAYPGDPNRLGAVRREGGREGGREEEMMYAMTSLAYSTHIHPSLPPSLPPSSSQAERFMLEMMKLPDVRDRINTLIFMRTFYTKLADLQQDVTVRREGGREGGREG